MEIHQARTPSDQEKLAQIRDLAQSALDGPKPEALTGAKTDALVAIIKVIDLPLEAMTREQHAELT